MINANKDMIYNLFHFVNKKEFNFLVKKYNGDFSCKSINTWKYFVSLVIGQLQDWKSLRDIELGMDYIESINNIDTIKRRFYDFGVTEGVKIKLLYISPSKNIRAYKINNSIIKLFIIKNGNSLTSYYINGIIQG